MPWRGPQYEGEIPSLGWLLLDWFAAYLPSPADTDRPLLLTDEQATLALRWYGLDPDTGEFVYRRGCLEMVKGWGKSPFMGAVSLAELAAPVLFDGWDASGEPVGRPWGTLESPPPWVQIAAVSEDQTENTYGSLYEMLTANEHRAATDLGIDEGRTRLYLRGRRGRLEPVTASAGSRQGQRITFAVLDETHLWTPGNGGTRLAATLRLNAGKMAGRTFETTNAPVLGDHSVAEDTGKTARAARSDILFYAKRPVIEPDPSWSDAQLIEALREVYGDARWAPLERLVAEIRDPATDWNDSLRFYFNLRRAGVGRAVDPRRWEQLARRRDVPPGAYIGLGFDGSISGDATVLRACTADGYGFLIDHWVRPKGPGAREWKVPREAVHEAVASAFSTYTVGRMLCDPPKWWTEIEEWSTAYGEEVVLALDTNQQRRFAPAVDRWLTAIREGTHTHDGDTVTSEHVKAAHLRKARVRDPEDDDRTLYVLVRGEDGRLIDAAVADVLAHEAAKTMPPEPPPQEPLVAWV